MSDPLLHDPFLRVHQRRDYGYFSVSGKYSPGSVRDQMVRATAVVLRAYSAKLIDNTNELLVIGAGAAGVSAAIQATALGVRTTLIEQEANAFARQAKSNRHIDPTEYDWPAPHWNVGQLPIGDDYGMPLSWGRGLASIVAVKWALALEDFVVQNRPVLNVLYKTKFLTAEPTASRRLRSKLKDCIQDREFERESSLVLDCRGAGAERVSVGNFSSREFWEADPSHIFRVESQSSPRVLVSGGGDGALQDFLGLMIPGKSAREIYENFSEATKVFIEKRIWSIEDEARRSFIWNSDSYQDCVVLSRQHRAHLELIDQVLNDSVIGPEVGGILDNLVKPKTAVAKISLAFHCSHFHPSYALNRFLVLLLDAHLRRNGHSSPLQPNRRLKAVHSAETEDVHQCHNSAIECSRFPHFVYFAQASCEREGTSQPEKEKFDAIVVRHGVQGDLPMLSRQILPYALLWA